MFQKLFMSLPSEIGVIGASHARGSRLLLIVPDGACRELSFRRPDFNLVRTNYGKLWCRSIESLAVWARRISGGSMIDGRYG
jgi:hypothetical protein